MTCEDFDGLLCDYLDDILTSDKRQLVGIHIDSCASCAQLVRDSRFAMELADRSEGVEPPRELVTRILYQVPQRASFSQKWVGGKLRGLFAPVTQPRFVMGAMLTVLSLSMMTRCAGRPQHALTVADLDPARLWGSLDDKVHRTYDRSVKAYESMRLVYEVQSRVADWKQKQQDDEEESLKLPKSQPKKVSEPPAKDGQRP